MSPLDIIRAWKNEEYRLSLSDAERAMLPAHPAGLIELGDAELEGAAAGYLDKSPDLGCTGVPWTEFPGCPTNACVTDDDWYCTWLVDCGS